MVVKLRTILHFLSLAIVIAAIAIPLSISFPETVLAVTYGCGVPYGVNPLTTQVNYLANPIGGGLGYSPLYTAATSDYVVSTAAQLKAALASAASGDIVYVANGATCTMTASTIYDSKHFVYVPAGVTLAGGRGGVGVTEGKIAIDASLVSKSWKTLIYLGANADVCGLEIDGPDETTADTNYYNGVVAGTNSQIFNNNIHGFGYTGVNVNGASGVVVHHNYIHNNQKTGLGYGVLTTGTSGLTVPIYEGNIFDYNRHHESASRGTLDGRYASFTFRYNYLGAHCTNTQLDVHGQDDGSGLAAGGTWYYYNNTSINTSQPFVGIRGYPETWGYVYQNWTYSPATQLWTPMHGEKVHAINEQMSQTPPYYYNADTGGAWVQMTVEDNWYGTSDPPSIPDDPADIVTTQGVSSITNTSALLEGSLTIYDPDTQYSQNQAFVWDDASHDNPGNTAPDVSAYSDYWDSAEVSLDNITVSHWITGLTEGTTYYVRFATDWAVPGDWEYGEEVSFVADDSSPCATLYEFFNYEETLDYTQNIYDPDYMSMQVFQAHSTHTVNRIRLPLFSDNVIPASTVTVGLWSVTDEGSEDFVPDALLTSGTFDYAAINSGEPEDSALWYSFSMSTEITVTDNTYYGIVLSLDGDSIGGVYEVLYWNTDDNYAHNWLYNTNDGGATWTRDATPMDAMYEIYGGDCSSDCELQEAVYGRPTGDPIWWGADPISTEIWSAQNILPDDNYTVTDISLFLYKSGVVDNFTVSFYVADHDTWYPTGPVLASSTIDASTITTDNSGEWVDLTLDTTLYLSDYASENIVYVMVLTSDAVFSYPGSMNCVVWAVTPDEGVGNYMYTYDSGATWSWSNDGLYELWDCSSPGPIVVADAMFQVWGEGSAPYGTFMNQLPNLFKLASLLGIIIAAIVVFRGGNKGRNRYFG